MSNPKEQREKIALIDDLLKCPGYTEWFVPAIHELIASCESVICDEATSPEQTLRSKVMRTTLLDVLRMPGEIHAGCRNNIKSFVDGVKRTPPEA